MKVILLLIGAALVVVAAWFANSHVAPLFLNSRIERLHEKNLPRVIVERGTIYCRMKADDFRFHLPGRARAVNPVVAGGFDTVDGTVEARFDGIDGVTASEYENSIAGKVQVGGQVTAQTIPGGLLIKFHYFGDR